MVHHPLFDNLILAVIALSSVKLVVDGYIDVSTGDPTMIMLSDVSSIVDLVFAIIFFIECGLKIMAFGFVLDKNSYLRETWNVLDFFIVLVSILDLAVSSVSIGFVKILRMLRTLRPLRVISHNQNMKVMVNALLNSFAAILNLIVVLFFVL
jgi:hypothetical protein